MIDLNTLLDPIDPTNRGGVSLLYEGVHQEIMEARREDDASLPRGDWSRPLKVADWQDVTNIGTNTLLKKSKDLRVAVMLTEALIYQEGMAGFNAATSFLIKFVEIFWDDMHPKIEEPADLESRMLILEWFSEKCGFAIKFQNITSPVLGHVAYNLVDWFEVEKLIKAGPVKLTRRQRMESQPEELLGPSIQSFEDSVTATPTEWLKSNKELIAKTLIVLNELDELIANKMPDNIPNFRPLRETVNQIHSKSVELIQIREQTEAELEIQEKASANNSEAIAQSFEANEDKNDAVTAPLAKEDKQSTEVKDTIINSRAEAYEALAKITAYLMEVDPHSPTPYLLRKAVSFRDMTFADLLTVLVDDEWHRTNLLKLIGVGNTSDNAPEK